MILSTENVSSLQQPPSIKQELQNLNINDEEHPTSSRNSPVHPEQSPFNKNHNNNNSEHQSGGELTKIESKNSSSDPIFDRPLSPSATAFSSTTTSTHPNHSYSLASSLSPAFSSASQSSSNFTSVTNSSNFTSAVNPLNFTSATNSSNFASVSNSSSNFPSVSHPSANYPSTLSFPSSESNSIGRSFSESARPFTSTESSIIGRPFETESSSIGRSFACALDTDSSSVGRSFSESNSTRPFGTSSDTSATSIATMIMQQMKPEPENLHLSFEREREREREREDTDSYRDHSSGESYHLL